MIRSFLAGAFYYIFMFGLMTYFNGIVAAWLFCWSARLVVFEFAGKRLTLWFERNTLKKDTTLLKLLLGKYLFSKQKLRRSGRASALF